MWGMAAGRTCEEEGSQSGAPLGASPETEGADMTLTEETLMVRGVRGDEDGVEDVRDEEGETSVIVQPVDVDGVPAQSVPQDGEVLATLLSEAAAHSRLLVADFGRVTHRLQLQPAVH